MNPVVAVALGWWVLHETLEPRTVVAGAIIVIGVALIISARSGAQRPDSGDGTGG